MELWIRSQDRRILQKVDNIYLNANYDNKRICSFIDGDEMELATYKTKERALEVLDAIHQRLVNIQCLELTGADYISNQMKRNGIDCVYLMPEN